MIPAARRLASAGLKVALLGLAALSICAVRIHGSEVDRLLVAVNGSAITEGDLEIAGSLNRLIFPGKRIEPGSRAEAIDRLIDLELMRQELKNFSISPEDESSLEIKVNALRDSLAGAEGLSVLLERLGLEAYELDSFLRLEISIAEFVEFRFRSFAGVSEADIKIYYEDRLAPQLKERGLQLPSLSQASSRIEEILKEEKINNLLDQWIKDIRRNSRIEYFYDRSPLSDPDAGESPVSPDPVQDGTKEKLP